MTTLFPSAFLILLRIKFICLNLNFDSNSCTGIILRINVAPPNNVTIIKRNVVLAAICIYPKNVTLNKIKELFTKKFIENY